MTPATMAAHCHEQITLSGPDAYVLFVVPTVWKGQKRMQLAGPGSPMGEPVGHVGGGTAAFFGAWDVLRWLRELNREMVEGIGVVEGIGRR